MEKILDFFKERKILCGFVFLILSTVTFFTLYIMEATAEESFTCPKLELLETEEEESDNMITVDVKGAVENEGVYRVKKGTIIQEVLVLAGGLKKDADTSNLNLSKKVSNEMVITVFTKEEIKKLDTEKKPINETTSKEDSKPTGLISLNTASLEELMTLPGVGEAKAKIIIEYREKCGKFKKKEELKNIKGIGEKIYEKLESYITI